MENKKLLIIVPPMSTPVKKLNEVLDSIAEEYNIDISIVDDLKELAQAVASSDQCLVVFSNAKKCASFLQENRLALSKAHSKVLLFTPKEIPSKTLTKFVKIGLTEAILENSAPKTLLYKIKLLLRSIKSKSISEDTKNQSVKKLNVANNLTDQFEDNNKNDDRENKDTFEVENQEDKKTTFENETIDYSNNLKSKNSYKEEAFDTNWKSKLNKTNQEELDAEEESKKIKSDEQNNIDLYLRGKNKNNVSIQFLDDEDPTDQKLDSEDELENKSKNKKNDIEIELDKSEGKKKNNFNLEESSELTFQSRKNLELELEDPENAPDLFLTEEEMAAARQKEYDELDALFEAAKQKEGISLEDLGGYLEGKINNTNLELEDENNDLNEKEDYDNSEIKKQKKKNIQLSLEEEESPDGIILDEENENDSTPNEGVVDNLDSELQSGKSSTDKIETYMTAKINNKKDRLLDGDNLNDLDDSLELTKEDQNSEKTKKNKFELENPDEDPNKDKNTFEETEEDDSSATKKNIELAFDQDETNSDTNLNEESLEDGSSANDLQLTELDLDSTEKSRSNQLLEENQSDINYKKLNQTDLEFEKDRQTHEGSVDKIDTYYRSHKAQDVEHNWDNLAGRGINTISGLEEKEKRGDEFSSSLVKKNLGEQTIDYRKIKEEFDQISKVNNSDENNEFGKKKSNQFDNSEDEGSFKVIEINARGFEFGIEVVNLMYQKESKPIEFYKLISEELIKRYSAYPIFYSYKPSDKKHIETFNSFLQFTDSLISNELSNWWAEVSADKNRFTEYFSKTITTWLCREIEDKSGDNEYWQDVELPSWAANELNDKQVEMIFPYFDGLDRMGVAILIFPSGIIPAKEKSLIITLEMVRTVMLDSIQRALVSANKEQANELEPQAEKKNIKNLFSGLFSRNKAG